MRGLSTQFIEELKNGILSKILLLVKNDSTMCLEIRDNYINIYYRGGNILRIKEKNGRYTAHFDIKYLDSETTRISEDLPGVLNDVLEVDKWVMNIPFLKNEMDLWFGKNPKSEREFQQLVARENNQDSSAKGTDYFILDIEYANSEGRFDMIAVHWPSNGAARKNNKELSLAFIEMKYGDSALAGSAGLTKHIKDMNNFLKESDNLNTIKKEMKQVFNQKLELGLINNQHMIESFKDAKPEYIFILANHDPDSTILWRELQLMKDDSAYMEIKFAVSNFMGYGLYEKNIYNLNDFSMRFKDQIRCKS